MLKVQRAAALQLSRQQQAAGGAATRGRAQGCFHGSSTYPPLSCRPRLPLYHTMAASAVCTTTACGAPGQIRLHEHNSMRNCQPSPLPSHRNFSAETPATSPNTMGDLHSRGNKLRVHGGALENSSVSSFSRPITSDPVSLFSSEASLTFYVILFPTSPPRCVPLQPRLFPSLFYRFSLPR